MSLFMMITLHYIKRMLRDPKEIVLLLIIPLGVIIFNTLIAGAAFEQFYFFEYNIMASFTAPAMMLSFQFFNSFFMFIFLYRDLRSKMRWRLLASPHSVRTFAFPALIANWLVSILLGTVIIVITSVFLNVYWGNLFVLAAVLAVTSLMGTFTAILIFLFTKEFKKANAIAYVVSFGLMVVSGFMIPLQMFGDNAVTRFLLNHGTPLSLGQAAIISSGALDTLFAGTDVMVFMPGTGVNLESGLQRSLINIGVLAAITLGLGVIAAIAARRKKI